MKMTKLFLFIILFSCKVNAQVKILYTQTWGDIKYGEQSLVICSDNTIFKINGNAEQMCADRLVPIIVAMRKKSFFRYFNNLLDVIDKNYNLIVYDAYQPCL